MMVKASNSFLGGGGGGKEDRERGQWAAYYTSPQSFIR